MAASALAGPAARLIAAPAPASASGNTAAPAGQPRIWRDERIAHLPARPWRKVHLDFHNTPHIGKIGERFDAAAWGDQLVAANVNAIVVFAKDMHGYFYYPSKFGPVHPGLAFDLLGAQVRACRERNIAVYAYYCTSWDHHLAQTQPEWRMLKRNGTNYLPAPDRTPGWTALCLGNSQFVDLMVEHTREFVSRYELDGAWFDMSEPIAPECFCAECQRQLRARGQDPKDADAQRAYQHEVFLAFHRRMQQVVRETRPRCQTDFNDIGLARIGDRVATLDNIDIEALPTGGGWGYFYFPTLVRYSRNFGVTTYGQTGRFKSSWADFGGLKLPTQLDVELASIVANGARCAIGDQMPPSGRLDPAVYDVIGRAYERIRRLEPFLEGAAPVVEAALMTPGRPLDRLKQDSTYGLVKLMLECRLQFDVVEPEQPWERYGLIVLEDDFQPTPATAERLRAYVRAGGAVIACHRSGLREKTEESWLQPFGLSYAGASAFAPAYLVPDARGLGDIPDYEYALYEGASQWRAEAPARRLARLGEPAFQRSAKRYTSHAHTPFDHVTDYAAVACSGRFGLIGFPLGRSYFRHGYWVYRAAFQRVLDLVLPHRMVGTSAPLSTEITVTHQAADSANRRPERYLVHLINFSAVRATPQHPAFHEDPIPLTDVAVRLNVGLASLESATLLSGARVPLQQLGEGRVEFKVPRVDVHEVVCLNVGRAAATLSR